MNPYPNRKVGIPSGLDRTPSFFKHDVSLSEKGRANSIRWEKGGQRGGRGACRRDRLHRFIRDSFAGAACAGPKAENRARKPRTTTIRWERGENDGNGRREAARYSASRTASDVACGALSSRITRRAAAGVARLRTEPTRGARHGGYRSVGRPLGERHETGCAIPSSRNHVHSHRPDGPRLRRRHFKVDSEMPSSSAARWR